MTDIDLDAIKAERARLAAEYITAGRPPTSARGIHHAALICSDVEQTIKFYQGLLEFPLTELFGNRDYKGSTHFFFDVGNGNLLAFFDFPGLDLGPYLETLGNINHIAISVTKEKWDYLRGKLDAAGVEYQRGERHLDLLQGPGRRPPGAARRPARRDVRHQGPVTPRPMARRDLRQPQASASRREATAAVRSALTGIHSRTVVPVTGAEVRSAWPPCATAIACTIDRPRPLLAASVPSAGGVPGLWPAGRGGAPAAVEAVEGQRRVALRHARPLVADLDDRRRPARLGRVPGRRPGCRAACARARCRAGWRAPA